MKERNSVLYQFHDLNNFWIVAISHKNPLKLGIEPRVWSRLSPILVKFESYSISEMVVLLNNKLKSENQSVRIPDEEIWNIARQAEGDAHKAKNLLQQKLVLGTSENNSFRYPGSEVEL